MSTIDEMIKNLIDESVTEAIENGVVTEDNFGDALSAADVLTADTLDDYSVLTADNFDPSDYDLLSSRDYDLDEFVSRDDLPDFDDFIRHGDVEIESGVVDLLNQYSPFGCSTAMAANRALARFFGSVLTTSEERIDECEDVQAALVNFIAANADAIEQRKVAIKAERKAAKAEAKKQAKKQAKAERKAVKEAERIAAEAAQSESV